MIQPFGRIADVLFLERYMRNLLAERNAVLKQLAEATPLSSLTT